jgi:hypothetical protein
MAGSEPDALNPGEVYFCVNHPHTETLIRCSKCLDPICPKCAIRTPVGLRCRKCAHPGRSPLYTLTPIEYVIASAISLATSLIAGTVMTQIGLLFAIFLSAPVGGIVAEAVSRSLHGRRGRALQIIVSLGILLGAIGGPWLWAAIAAGNLALIPTNILTWLASLLRVNTLVYAFLAIGAAIARLR